MSGPARELKKRKEERIGEWLVVNPWGGRTGPIFRKKQIGLSPTWFKRRKLSENSLLEKQNYHRGI